VLVEAHVVSFATGSVDVRPVDDLGLRYRHSDLRPSDIVARATFRTSPGDPAEGEDLMREVTRWRKAHQPGGTLNAGSVFKNPPDDAAGRLIESAGLKGLTVGGARVSERHANFIEADRRATASDIRTLVREVRRRVRDHLGVDLEPEIAFVGPFD
ncbi:MAG: UDP-N-acetylenolpyruvoylglucosamine reductase, partial [Acidimicrobiia bacterium]|nr:UDP-N-acetylenolpyruvoylglucosamine reductase [Acidimicrobiia bacterium]